jgi:hypothetical protein
VIARTNRFFTSGISGLQNFQIKARFLDLQQFLREQLSSQSARVTDLFTMTGRL